MHEVDRDILREPGVGEGITADRAEARGRASGKARVYHPLVELTLARLREFLREKEAVFWVFVFPVLLAFALGIAFRNTAPETLKIAVEATDQARLDGASRASQVAAALSKASGLQGVVQTPEQAAASLRTGKVALIVRLPSGPDGEAALGPGKTAQRFDYVFDPTRPESRIARLSVDDALQRSAGRADVASVGEEKVTEPGARYIDFLIPGLIGMNLMGSGLWGLGFAVVQARTRKLLKRFAATPMRRSHYLLSFMLSRLVFLALEVVAVVVFAWLAFGVSVHGRIVDLAAVALIGSLTFAGIGLLVASRPKTIEGVSGLMNLVMLPMWLLSGTFFSASRFPDFLQPAIKALPLTALNDSLRSVMNDGATLAASWSAIAIMLGWGLISFALALRLFRWQ
jgi:ABC-type multidrug transport system permease subunit